MIKPQHKPATRPSPAQKEALQRAVADGGRLVYLTGGFWTTPNCPLRPFEYQGRTTQIPTWSVARGTILALESRGWLVSTGTWRNAPREVTPLGISVLQSKE